jgi:soluble lytic murein transglycosylase-like protein
MTSPRILCSLTCGWLVLGLTTPAQAQIYVWKDANGNPVYSGSVPPRGQHRTYTVARSSVLATRPVVSGYQNQYDALIEQYAREQGVRSDLVRAVIQVESGFNARARSAKGAMGLMQLMPATAAELGVKNPYNPRENIRGGVGYLRSLLDRYGNDETLALAAYNAGPTAVERYGNTIPPYRETQDYVDRVQTISPVLAAARAASRVIYRTMDLVDGRMVPHYSNAKPGSGTYDVIRLGR